MGGDGRGGGEGGERRDGEGGGVGKEGEGKDRKVWVGVELSDESG